MPVADGANTVEVLYLVACDQHGRSREGTPMIAGTRFTAPKGFPALPWGCGPIYQIDVNAPRWLIVMAESTGEGPGTTLVFEGRIVADGDRTTALRYLHEHGAAGMPYLGRRRRGGSHAVLTVGSLGTLEAEDHVIAAGGEATQVTAGPGATVALGRAGQAKAGEFARIVTNDGAQVRGERFSTVASGRESTIQLAEGALVLAGEGSEVRVGDGGRAMVDGGGSIDLGIRAVGIGRNKTRYRGAEGAQFVALDAITADGVTTVTARVGVDGVLPATWYVVVDGRFVAESRR